MVRKFSKLELNYPGPLAIDGVGHIRCPTISEVVQCRVSLTDNFLLWADDAYNYYLELLVISKNQVVERFAEHQTEDVLKELDKLSLFQILTLIPELREQLQAGLNFFFEEEVIYNTELGVFVLYQQYVDSVGIIDDKNFINVKNLILQRCHISPPKITEGKRRSKRMIEFDKKIEEGRKHSSKYKNDQKAMELGNIVSKVAAQSNAADINDIYDWTVYQLYEQFNEINASIQIETILNRWSVWGKDDFDFSIWYKPNSTD